MITHEIEHGKYASILKININDESYELLSENYRQKKILILDFYNLHKFSSNDFDEIELLINYILDNKIANFLKLKINKYPVAKKWSFISSSKINEAWYFYFNKVNPEILIQLL